MNMMENEVRAKGLKGKFVVRDFKRTGFAPTIENGMVATKTGAGYQIQADGSWRKVREKRDG